MKRGKGSSPFCLGSMTFIKFSMILLSVILFLFLGEATSLAASEWLLMFGIGNVQISQVSRVRFPILEKFEIPLPLFSSCAQGVSGDGEQGHDFYKKSSRDQCSGARTILIICHARGLSSIRKRMRLQASTLSVFLKNIVEGRDGRMRSLDLY